MIVNNLFIYFRKIRQYRLQTDNLQFGFNQIRLLLFVHHYKWKLLNIIQKMVVIHVVTGYCLMHQRPLIV